MSKKILIIGFDGGDWPVLNSMIEKGKMPTLEKIMNRGTYGVLNSTVPPATPAAWTSFQTGVYPQKHGILDFFQYRPGSYKPILISSKDIKLKTIWEILNELGKKVILVGLPITYPPPVLDGIVISCFLTPGLESNFIYPQTLKKELLNAIGDYRFSIKQVIVNNIDRLIKEFIYIEKKRTAAAEFLFRNYGWDVGFVQFQSVDTLQHILWPLLDPESKEYSIENWEKVSHLYQIIDGCITKLLDAVGDNTDIIIISDHGFGPTKKIIFLNNWLEANGFLNLKRSPLHLINIAKKADFLKLRRKFFSLTESVNLLGSINQGLIDWKRTKAWMLSGAYGGNIYLNRKGRDIKGIVSKDDYIREQNEIKRRLMSLKDPQTGESIIKNIYYHEQLFSGELRDSPDLFIQPNNGYYFSRDIGLFTNCFKSPIFKKDGEMGSHYPNGIYIFSGPSLKIKGRGEEANIVDVPATILTIMKIKTPEYFEGKIMKFVLKEEHMHLLSKNGCDKENIENDDKNNIIYSKEEQEEIEGRLKGLGYF